MNKKCIINVRQVSTIIQFSWSMFGTSMKKTHQAQPFKEKQLRQMMIISNAQQKSASRNVFTGHRVKCHLQPRTDVKYNNNKLYACLLCVNYQPLCEELRVLDSQDVHIYSKACSSTKLSSSSTRLRCHFLNILDCAHIVPYDTSSDAFAITGFAITQRFHVTNFRFKNRAFGCFQFLIFEQRF